MQNEGSVEVYSEGVDRYTMTLSQEGVWNRVSKNPDIWEMDLGECFGVQYKCHLVKERFRGIEFKILSSHNVVAEEKLKSRSIIGAIEEVSKYFMECALPLELIKSALASKSSIKGKSKSEFDEPLEDIDSMNLNDSMERVLSSSDYDSDWSDDHDDMDSDFEEEEDLGEDIDFYSNPKEPVTTPEDVESVLDSLIREEGLIPNIQVRGSKIIGEAHENEDFADLDDPSFTVVLEINKNFMGEGEIDRLGSRVPISSFNDALSLKEAIKEAL